MRKKLVCILIIMAAAIALSAIVVLLPHTSPVPPEVRAGWYMPSQDIVWAVPGSDSFHNRTERFTIAGERDGATQFPALSPYSRYINYTREGSDTRYMIAVWYFTDETTFRDTEKMLLAYLAGSGKPFAVDMNISQRSGVRGNPADGLQNENTPAIAPTLLRTTGYQGDAITGYFFTVTRAGSVIHVGNGIIPTNKEYYLVYYGTTTPSDLSSQTEILRGVIAETYSFDMVLSQDAL